LFIDFVHNFEAGMEVLCQAQCLLKDVRILSILFLETPVLFAHYALLQQLVMQPHLNYW